MNEWMNSLELLTYYNTEIRFKHGSYDVNHWLTNTGYKDSGLVLSSDPSLFRFFGYSEFNYSDTP